jgi:hypothetical protein
MTETSSQQRPFPLRPNACCRGIVLIAIAVMVFNLLPCKAFAFPKGTRPPARVVPEEAPPAEPTPPEHPSPTRRECESGDRACHIDQAVDEVEIEVEAVAHRYREGSIWTIDDGSDKPLTTGQKVTRDILNVPVYIGRALTWPVALLGHFLIQEGFIRKTIDICSNDERTLWVYPRLELGFGSGFGGGVGVRHYDVGHTGWRLGADYVVHVNLDQSGTFTLSKPDLAMLAGRPLSLQTGVSLTHLTEAAFYGMGATSQRGDDASYLLDELQAGAEVGYEPFKDFYGRMRLNVIADTTSQGKSSPSVDQLFPPSDLVGFGKQLVYLATGIHLVHDNSDAIAAPEHGGVQELSLTYYQGLGSTRQDYVEWRLDAEQYLRLWLPRHVLALRTSWVMQHSTGAESVPFFRLASFDINSPARGFSSGRFRDTNRAVFNIEYRYPIWRFLDGDLFFDTGRVFHGATDFSFKHFRYSGGGGLRMRTTNFFLFRAELGYGGEGVHFLFKTSQAF